MSARAGEVAQGAQAAPPTAERLLDAAERRVRVGGYNGFSFRDLAADVGIRSASVHHHFPTKEALVARLAERYADRFVAALPAGATGAALVEAYRDAFRAGLEADPLVEPAADGRRPRQMCLCGILGAEVAVLPPSVARAARRFFERTADHLARGIEGAVADPRAGALAVLARLEGAMILSRALDDPRVYDAATEGLLPAT
ncbi:MAG: TetR/AcrR family transcriptional regulator [Pseudomonadota bacterium]